MGVVTPAVSCPSQQRHTGLVPLKNQVKNIHHPSTRTGGLSTQETFSHKQEFCHTLQGAGRNGLAEVTQGRIPEDSSDGRQLEQANSPRGKAEERQRRPREGRGSYCRAAVWDNTNIL